MKINTYYRSKDNGTVVFVTDFYGINVQYCYLNSTTLNIVSTNSFKKMFPNEIVPPEKGKLIRLLRNFVIKDSPNIGKVYRVDSISRSKSSALVSDEYGGKANLDLLRWEWEVVQEDPNSSTEFKNVIEKDGKLYLLVEIKQPVYQLGDVINDNHIVVDIKPTPRGVWQYSMWNRKEHKLDIVEK